MNAQEIMEGLFFIQRGYLNGNHFAYCSEEPILIDTGYLGHFDETEQRLRRLGVDPSKVRLIISTHTHCEVSVYSGAATVTTYPPLGTALIAYEPSSSVKALKLGKSSPGGGTVPLLGPQ